MSQKVSVVRDRAYRERAPVDDAPTFSGGASLTTHLPSSSRRDRELG